MNSSKKTSQANRKFNPLVVGFTIVAFVVLLGFCNYKSSRDIQSIQPQAVTAKTSEIPKGDAPAVDIKSSKSDAITIQTDSRIALKNYLKDPTSAEIRNHKGNCGEVNSKNSFGGYSGYRRFIASPAIVVIEGENMSSEEFQKAWDKLC